MPIPSSKEIIELVKLGATLPAQEKIMELRVLALELQEENLTLKSRVRELEAELNQKKNLRHERGLYWMAGDPIPFCPRCQESAGKLIHLFGPSSAGKRTGYACHTCHHDFISDDQAPFNPRANIHRRYDAERKL